MNDPVALITGASRAEGIGIAVARELAQRSVRVVLAARQVDKAQDLADRLTGEGLTASALRLDVTDADSVKECAKTMSSQFGQLDVLINNASIVPDLGVNSVLDANAQQVLDAFDVDVVGSWQLTLALLPQLRKAPAARIVNISSESSLRMANAKDRVGGVMQPAHAMAKYALNALTVTLADALRDTPILVNAVDPGGTNSHPAEDPGGGRPPAESAKGIVWAATLGPDGPTGGLFRDGHPLT